MAEHSQPQSPEAATPTPADPSPDNPDTPGTADSTPAINDATAATDDGPAPASDATAAQGAEAAEKTDATDKGGTEPPQSAQLPTGPGFALTFLYYFSGSVLVATFLAIKSLGYGMETGLPGQFIVLVGAVGGFFGGFFNHTMTFTVRFKSRKQFLKTLVQDTLEPMGYELAETVDDIRVYKRPALRQLFSGKIYVEVQSDRAILASRAVHIRALRKKLVG